MTDLSITATARRAQYTGSTSTGPYQFSFIVFDEADLAVYKNATLLTLTTNYTVSLNTDGTGSVTLLSAPLASDIITIVGAMALERTSNYRPGSALSASALNTDLNRVVVMVQQLQEAVARSIGRSINDDDNGADLVLPAAATRANKALIFDADGNVTTSTDDYEDQATAAAASAAAASASASAASTSASNAATSESNAATSESNASSSASSASASAAAAAVSAGSGLFGTLSNKSADFTVVADTDNATLFIVDTSGGSVTVTLPSIATAGEGERYGFMRTSASNSLILARNGSDTINGAASNYTLPAVAGEVTVILADDATPDNWILLPWTQAVADETTLTKSGSTISIKSGGVGLTQMATAAKTEVIAIACSDETTALTAGTGKIAFRMPYAFTVTAVRASLTTAQTSGSTFTVDINETGTSILGTKLTIDNTEKTSTTAATAATITDTALADDAEITVDIDQIGDGTANGLKVYLIGYKA